MAAMVENNESPKIELVAIDLDGTLLASDGSLPPGNKRAILKAIESGVGVILATGKTRSSAVELIGELGIALPSVFSQGLIIQEADGRIMREISLEDDLAEELVAYLEQRRLPYIVYNRHGLLTPWFDDYNDPISGKYDEPQPRVVGALAGQAGELRVNKLLVGDREDLQARRRDLEQRFGQQATIYQAVPEWVEIIPKDLNKGAGVRWLLERLRIKPEAIMAIGDGENDIEMLQLAGIGVAVGNANPKLKAVADHLVGTNDDAGVAEALDRFVLARQKAPIINKGKGTAS
jgi:Cof subfamily protein (haloacid dehalogenase superfamily)